MITRRHLIALSAASAFAPSLLTSPRAGGGVAGSAGAHDRADRRGRSDRHQRAHRRRSSFRRFGVRKSSSTTRAAPAPISATNSSPMPTPTATPSCTAPHRCRRTGRFIARSSYSPTKDLAPVSLVAKFPFFMFVPNSSPAKTVAEFIDLRQGESGQAHHGIARDRQRAASLRSAVHADGAHPDDACALSRRGAGLHRSHTRPHQCYFGSGELLTYSRSGQVRVLGSSGAKRSPAAPDVPTIGETVPGYEVESWQAIFAPAKTPPEIVQKMNAGIVKALAERRRSSSKFEKTAYTPTPSSPEELGKFLKADTAKWSAIIKSAGLKID